MLVVRLKNLQAQSTVWNSLLSMEVKHFQEVLPVVSQQLRESMEVCGCLIWKSNPELEAMPWDIVFLSILDS